MAYLYQISPCPKSLRILNRPDILNRHSLYHSITKFPPFTKAENLDNADVNLLYSIHIPILQQNLGILSIISRLTVGVREAPCRKPPKGGKGSGSGVGVDSI